MGFASHPVNETNAAKSKPSTTTRSQVLRPRLVSARIPTGYETKWSPYSFAALSGAALNFRSLNAARRPRRNVTAGNGLAARRVAAEAFRSFPKREPKASAILTIQTDGREGLDGYWTKTFPVKGGQHYRFSALRKLENVPSPRRSAVVRLLWQDDKGNSVPTDERNSRQRRVARFQAHGRGRSSGGQERPMPMAGRKSRMSIARQRKQRAPWWNFICNGPRTPKPSGAMCHSLRPAAPPPRKVRLAAVHYRPQGGKSMMDNCREFAPLIADAAKQRADLVVLPETLTYYGLRKKYAECAEPVPGPSTDYFGTLAKQHNLYIVAGLLRARRASRLQRRGAHWPRWQVRRQVSQDRVAARRNRRRHFARQRVSRSSTRASANSA